MESLNLKMNINILIKKIFGGLGNKSVIRNCTLTGIFLAFYIILVLGYDLELNNFKLYSQDGAIEEVELPLSRTSTSQYASYKLTGDFSIGWFSPSVLHVTPDDGVEKILINDQLVDLTKVNKASLTDWVHGFQVDIGDYLKPGVNTISISYWDRGGNGLMGMQIEYAPQNSYLVVLHVVWVFILIPVVLSLVKRLKISKLKLILYLGIIAGGITQVILIFQYNPLDHIWSDSERHWAQGTDLLRVDLMSMTDPVGYQIFIAILAKLTLKIPALVAFYTSILALLAPWFWYRFFRELQPSKVLALSGWAFLSLLPSWMSIYSYFMQETLLLPLLGAAMWVTWRAKRKETLGSFLVMVVLWVLAGLTRGIAIPLAAIVCTWLWLVQEDKLRKATLATFVLILTIGPLVYRSYQTVGHFAPHGMGHLASIYAMSGKKEITLLTERDGSAWMHSFSSPSTGALPFAPISKWHTQRSGRLVVNVDFNNGKKDWDKAYDMLEMNWGRYLWLMKENLIFLFFVPSWPDNNQNRLIDNLNIEMRWLWAPVFFLCFVGCIIFRNELKGKWLLPSVLIVWFFIQGLLPISVNEGRYRKPFEGLLVAQALLLISVSRRKYRSVSRDLNENDFLESRLK